MGTVFFLVLACAVTGMAVHGESQVVDLSPVVNCSDVSSVMRLQQKCLDIYGVPVKLPDSDMLTNMSISTADRIKNIMRSVDPDKAQTLCNMTDNYVKSYLCGELISRKCMPEVPILDAVFPPEEKIRQQQAYMCANINNYNTSCVNDHIVEIAECANVTDAVPIDPLHVNTSELIENIMCMSFELASVCAKKYLKSCGDLTLQLYEVGQPDISVCRTSTVHSVDPGVDCSDKTSTRKGYLTCLVANGITLIVPEFDTSEDTSSFILQAMTLTHNKQMCSNLGDYKNAINCTLGLQRKCSDDLMKPTVPDSLTVQHGFDEFCKHIDNFDTPCVVKNTGNACAGRRRRSFAEQIILRHLCGDDAFRQQCMLSAVGSCGARTVSTYKQVLESQSPSKCLKQGHHVPVIG